jgi:hypothetical protein
MSDEDLAIHNHDEKTFYSLSEPQNELQRSPHLECISKIRNGPTGVGIRKWRIFGLSAVDLIATYGAALLFAYFSFDEVFVASLVYFFTFWIIGIGLHLYFCTPTPITKYIVSEYSSGEHEDSKHE